MNGSTNEIQELTYQKVVNDVKAFYGPVMSEVTDNEGKKITKFQTDRLNILVHERKFIGVNSGIVTIISPK